MKLRLIHLRFTTVLGLWFFLFILLPLDTRAADSYTENLLENPQFNYDAGKQAFPGWVFNSGGTYPGNDPEHFAAGLIAAGDWALVPDAVANIQHVYLAEETGGGLFVRNTIPAANEQYIARFGQTITTLPGTVYQVILPFSFIESTNNLDARYAYRIHAGNLTGTTISRVSWTELPPSGHTAASEFTAVSNHSTLVISMDQYGVVKDVGGHVTLGLKNPVVRARMMKTTIRGVLDDGTEIYSDSALEINSIHEKSVSAPEISGYRLKSGHPDTQQYTPDKDQTITFLYESKMSSVTLLAYLKDSTTPVPGYTPEVIPAAIGKSFIRTAPVIDGYVNVNPLPNPILVSGDKNELVFYYRKASGNLIIHAVDQDKGMEIGHVYKNLIPGATFSAFDGNAPTADEIPDLAYYQLIPGSGSPQSVTNTGDTETFEVTYQYQKNPNTSRPAPSAPSEAPPEKAAQTSDTAAPWHYFLLAIISACVCCFRFLPAFLRKW